MIDFHSHILPGMDDGSQNAAESLSLLNMLAQQGIETVVATPHFYAGHESVADFIARRSRSMALLQPILPENAPAILCGAEVQYYPGISKLPELEQLCIDGSSLLLLEMPISKWTEFVVSELICLTGRGNLTVALAHMERYLRLQSKSVLHRLFESGILMQYNADYFLGFSTRHKAISLLRSGFVHMLGSDCHNLSSRSPRLGEALDMIRKRLGEDCLSRLDEYGRSVLEN